MRHEQQVIAANLKKIRGFKDILQHRIAEAAGPSRGVYHIIEGGKAQPRVHNLIATTNAPKTLVHELLEHAKRIWPRP
ncbi:MAG: hypothetical protein GMKNLPBB_03101 [Myxococcota bacterium]|nr:hypothetical protein [Myxococcota bacterium]